MKKLGLLVMVGLAGLVWGQEREALRVEYEFTEPGEATTHWVETYFVDGEDRLSRMERVTDATFEGDPKERSSATFHWTDHGVRWEGSLWSGSAKLENGEVRISCRGSTQTYHQGWENGIFRWTAGPFQGRWSAELGFDERLISDPAYPAEPSSGCVSIGARVSVLMKGKEQARIIFDRQPKSYAGTFVLPLESGSGWYSCGSILFSGKGLWTANFDQFLLTFAILDNATWIPGWAPLFFQHDFLR